MDDINFYSARMSIIFDVVSPASAKISQSLFFQCFFLGGVEFSKKVRTSESELFNVNR